MPVRRGGAAPFGLGAPPVSMQFIRASTRQLQRLLERQVEAGTFPAPAIDGKAFAEDQIVRAVGVTFR
jgi:hypothetical protein